MDSVLIAVDAKEMLHAKRTILMNLRYIELELEIKYN